MLKLLNNDALHAIKFIFLFALLPGVYFCVCLLSLRKHMPTHVFIISTLNPPSHKLTHTHQPPLKQITIFFSFAYKINDDKSLHYTLDIRIVCPAKTYSQLSTNSQSSGKNFLIFPCIRPSNVCPPLSLSLSFPIILFIHHRREERLR